MFLEFSKNANNINLLDSFLLERFSDKGYMVVTDSWNAFDIYIMTEKQTFRFQAKGDYCQLPWYDFDVKEEALPINRYNPAINIFLLQILPNNFYGRERLLLENIKKPFLYWLIGKKCCKYDD